MGTWKEPQLCRQCAMQKISAIKAEITTFVESQHFWTAGFFTASSPRPMRVLHGDCSARICTAICSLYLKDLETVWSFDFDDHIDRSHPSTSIKSAMISMLKSTAHSVIIANNFAAGFPEALMGLKARGKNGQKRTNLKCQNVKRKNLNFRSFRSFRWWLFGSIWSIWTWILVSLSMGLWVGQTGELSICWGWCQSRRSPCTFSRGPNWKERCKRGFRICCITKEKKGWWSDVNWCELMWTRERTRFCNRWGGTF